MVFLSSHSDEAKSLENLEAATFSIMKTNTKSLLKVRHIRRYIVKRISTQNYLKAANHWNRNNALSVYFQVVHLYGIGVLVAWFFKRETTAEYYLKLLQCCTVFKKVVVF